MDQHENWLEAVAAREENRQANLERQSKDRLVKIIQKKMRTTFIGAVSAVEEVFGHLWGHNGVKSPSKTEQANAQLYNEVRGRILDIGNAQLRAIENELMQHTIVWNRYNYELKMEDKPNDDQV